MFWSSDSIFLNDPTETLYSYETVVDVLRDRSRGSGRISEIAAAVLPHVSAPSSDVFVASFYQDGDLLSQWRGYGAFGGGYSLGFRFNNQARPPIQMAWLIEVIYDKLPLISAIDEILSIFNDYVEASTDRWAIDDVVNYFPQTLGLLCLSFKNPAYSKEWEVRFITNRSEMKEHWSDDARKFGKVYYRTSKKDVVPFLKIGISFPEEQPAPLLPLKRVVIGPAVHFERNKKSLNRMLHDLGYDEVEIVPSTFPFAP